MKSTRIGFVTIVVLAASLIAGTRAANEAKSGQDQDKESTKQKLHDLMVERRDAFQQLVDVATAHNRDGTGTIDALFRAKNDLLEAELELAKNDDERIRIYEQRLDNFRELEVLLTRRHSSGLAPIESLISTKAE